MIDPELLRQMKKKAAEEGRTLQAVANDLLRKSIQTPRPRPYKLRWKGWKAELQPGVDICDRDHLFDLMEGR